MPFLLLVGTASGQSGTEQDDQESLEERVKALEEKVGEGPGGSDFRVYWKDSLRLTTSDEKFQLRIGGRLNNDWFWFDQDGTVQSAVGKQTDGTEFRRARLYLSGTLHENVEFKLQYDFAGGDADFQDVYAGLSDVPVVGNLRVGQFKEPMSIQWQTSSNEIQLMERALSDALVPTRGTGAMVFDNWLPDDLATWAVGVFRASDSFGDQFGNGEYAWTGRVTGLPVYEDEGRKLLHLGAGASLRHTNDARFRSQPETHAGPPFVDTGAILGGDDVLLYGLEAAGVLGPFGLQAEYNVARVEVDAPGARDADFHGHYVQASYFLTGESRRYNKAAGAFAYPQIQRSFLDEGGLGAWELVLRYSGLDLEDGTVLGGELQDWTVGLNWYLNPNSRVMFNHVMADLENVVDLGDSRIFQIRFQLHF